MELKKEEVILHIFIQESEAKAYSKSSISFEINGVQTDYRTFNKDANDSYILFKSTTEKFVNTEKKWDICLKIDKTDFVGNVTIFTTLEEPERSENVEISSGDILPIHCFAIYGYQFDDLPSDSQKVEVEELRQSKNGRRPLLIGHRGMGNSDAFPAVAVENTMKAFHEAAKCGLDLVEFDVHLSSDDVLCVYHNFDYVKAENGKVSEWKITDHTFKDLRKISLCKQRRDDEQDFPTFADLLRQIPRHLAFNVEIKTPTLYRNGTWSNGRTGDNINTAHCPPGSNGHKLNYFIDRVLQELFVHGGERQVVMSTFSPQVVAMVRAKQHRYPVFFLCRGFTRDPSINIDRNKDYVDPRCRTVEDAITWATQIQLAGVVTAVDNLLADNQLHEKLAVAGLEWLVWGAKLRDPQVVETLKKMKCSGVIFDDVFNVIPLLREVVDTKL